MIRRKRKKDSRTPQKRKDKTNESSCQKSTDIEDLFKAADKQIAAINREGFMAYFWNRPGLVLVSSPIKLPGATVYIKQDPNEELYYLVRVEIAENLSGPEVPDWFSKFSKKVKPGDGNVEIISIFAYPDFLEEGANTEILLRFQRMPLGSIKALLNYMFPAEQEA